MIPEIGKLLLIFSLATMLVNLVVCVISKSQNKLQVCESALRFNYFAYLTIAMSYLILTYGFLVGDFSIKYVAVHSSTSLPLIYKLTGVWGGHEGSFLLWTLFFAGLSTIAQKRLSIFELPIKINFTIAINALMIAFLSFLLITSDPFERLLSQMPTQGLDLNPLLQDIGFIIHPPMLFLGYTAYGVCFAFAVAVLITKEPSQKLFLLFRQFVRFAWITLSAGIVLGSWWAYRELGWGGWWFWDPVENASFLPWLTGTALLHTITVSQQTNRQVLWASILAFLSFGLSLFGTFLVRSDLITSVHSFAQSPGRGYFIFGILGLYILSCIVIVSKHQALRSKPVTAYSKPGFILINSIMLCVMMLSVLLGTLYPLLHELIYKEVISVGAPYFNAIMAPLFLLLIFLLCLGSGASYNGHVKLWAFIETRWRTMLISVALGCLLSFVFLQSVGVLTILSFFGFAWLLLSQLKVLFYQGSFRSSKLPMVCAHIGLAVTLLGILISQVNGVEHKVLLGKGEAQQVGPHQLVLTELTESHGENYHATELHFKLDNESSMVAEKRFYHVSKMPLTEAAIDTQYFSDLYISLGAPRDEGKWSMIIYYKPCVRLIWYGVIIMIISVVGGMLMRRRRVDG